MHVSVNDEPFRRPMLASRALRVFLVEDSAVVRDLVIEEIENTEGLSLAGYADTEREASEKLRDVPWDVVIVDIKLKQGTGLGVLRSLAGRDTQTRDGCKIMFSNFDDEEFRVLSERYGAQYFFDKASEFPELLALLKGLAARND